MLGENLMEGAWFWKAPIVQPCHLISQWLENVAVVEAGESGYIVIEICKAFSPTYLSCSKCIWGAGRFQCVRLSIICVQCHGLMATASATIIIIFMTCVPNI